ncbi:uncharacterized protein [Nicotiana tomentosiformis]|uniref:uncharacterized protein n=1 Tax=Nicotiana tomentosiformis TaxID=4098 RepID=UPI00388CE6F5
MTWDRFTHIFLDGYIPPSHREELQFQFDQLQQGQISVPDYEARFSELSRHELIILPTDAERLQRLQGRPVQQGHQSMITALVAPPAIRPPRGGGQVGRGRPRGGGQPGGGQPVGAPARFYAFLASPDAEASDAVITCIVSVCGKDVSVLFDLWSTYSYVSSLFAHFLDVSRESLGTPVYVSSGLEWKGLLVSASNQVISFLKARHMVEKGCLAYLAYVWDTTVETSAIDSVPVVREFSDVFPSYLPEIPLYRDIDFYIDLAPDT